MAKRKKTPRLEGLGGWLILPIIGLFVTIPILLYDLLSANATYEFNFYMGVLSLIDIIFIGWAITALILIFNKKKSVPKVMISLYIANIIVQGAVSFLINEYTYLIRALIIGAIWISYFVKSERVKNTFVK